jgi:hypothetical protein
MDVSNHSLMGRSQRRPPRVAAVQEERKKQSAIQKLGYVL